jgi:CheY-like chemotaxis protein
MFISYWEYRQNTEYFDAITTQLKVIIILDRREDSLVRNKNFIRIYKPFYVLPIVVALNGDQVFQSLGDSFRERQNFIAPEASILAVDDNIMNLKVVEGLLRPYKIKVFTALSGEEALRKIDSQDYDFVFMDHMMPEMDGVETLHRIRQKTGNYFQKVPIIALTANAIGGTREMFLAEGFQDFIAKPIEISVMERVLLRNLPSNKIIYIDEETQESIYASEAADAADDAQSVDTPLVTTPQVTETSGSEPAQMEQTVTENSNQSLILENINTETGMMYCGGMMEFYIEILQTYYTTGCEKITLMKEAFEKKDWENYRVLVHALKSTSLSIGAEQLSEWAKALEMAAKEGNADYIEEHHGETMQLYEDVMKTISENEIIYPKQ